MREKTTGAADHAPVVVLNVIRVNGFGGEWKLFRRYFSVTTIFAATGVPDASATCTRYDHGTHAKGVFVVYAIVTRRWPRPGGAAAVPHVRVRAASATSVEHPRSVRRFPRRGAKAAHGASRSATVEPFPAGADRL